MDDTYLTISRISEGIYKEKMSKFLAFAIPVSSVEDVKSNSKNIKRSITMLVMSAGHIC